MVNQFIDVLMCGAVPYEIVEMCGAAPFIELDVIYGETTHHGHIEETTDSMGGSGMHRRSRHVGSRKHRHHHHGGALNPIASMITRGGALNPIRGLLTGTGKGRKYISL